MKINVKFIEVEHIKSLLWIFINLLNAGILSNLTLNAQKYVCKKNHNIKNIPTSDVKVKLDEGTQSYTPITNRYCLLLKLQ